MRWSGDIGRQGDLCGSLPLELDKIQNGDERSEREMKAWWRGVHDKEIGCLMCI